MFVVLGWAMKYLLVLAGLMFALVLPTYAVAEPISVEWLATQCQSNDKPTLAACYAYLFGALDMYQVAHPGKCIPRTGSVASVADTLVTFETRMDPDKRKLPAIAAVVVVLDNMTVACGS
jgi:hypothetical protein